MNLKISKVRSQVWWLMTVIPVLRVLRKDCHDSEITLDLTRSSSQLGLHSKTLSNKKKKGRKNDKDESGGGGAHP